LALRRKRIEREVAEGQRKAEDVEPILILVKPSTIAQWVSDWESSSKAKEQVFSMSVYYGNKKSAVGKYAIGKGAECVDTWYEELEGEAKINNTGRVLLSSYPTFLARATDICRRKQCPSVRDDRKLNAKAEAKANANAEGADNSVHVSYTVDENAAPIVDNSKEDNAIGKGEQRVLHLLVYKAKFDVAIFDEAQALKNRTSHTHLMVKQLNVKARMLVTATPLLNDLRDIYGFLQLLWPADLPFDVQAEDLDKTKFDPLSIYSEDFDPKRPCNLAGEVIGSFIRPPSKDTTPDMRIARLRWDQAVKQKWRPWTAHPLAFYYAFKSLESDKGNTPQLMAKAGHKLLAPILRLLQSRRLMSTKLGDGKKIISLRNQIPRLDFHHITLDFSAYLQYLDYQAFLKETIKRYFAPHNKKDEVKPALEDPDNPDDPEEFDPLNVRADVARRLAIVTFHLALKDMTDDKKNPTLGKNWDEVFQTMVNVGGSGITFDTSPDKLYDEHVEEKNEGKKDDPIVLAGANDVEKMIKNGVYHGFSFFYLATHVDTSVPVPKERVAAVNYLCWQCPKLAWLAVFLHKYLPAAELLAAPPPGPLARKVVVFTKLPITQWYVSCWICGYSDSL
jgi:hypothetical protein